MTELALPTRDPGDVLDVLQYHLYGLEFYWSPLVPAGPVVFPAAELDTLGQAAARLLGLLREAAGRLGTDWRQRHEWLGLDERMAELFDDSPFDDEYADTMARPDVIWTRDGWRVIEFNVGSALGAQSYVHVLGRAWAELYGEPLARFRAASDPLRARGSLLTRLYRDFGADGPVLVIGLAEDIHLPTSRYYDVEVQQLAAAGFDAEYVEAADVYADPERYGRRFAAGVQRIVTEDWLIAGHDLRPMARLRRAGCRVLAPQSARVLNNKRLMAVLSEGREWLAPDDFGLVERFLPWTRQVVAETVEFEDGKHFLPDLLARARHRFVLKPADQNGSRGVRLGHECAEPVWADAVATALAAGTWIVQEYVRPERVPVPLIDTAARRRVTRQLPAIISPYLIDGRLAGGMVRFDIEDRDTAVHVSKRGIRLTSLAGW